MILLVAIVCMVGHDYQRIIDGINHWKLSKLIEAIYLLFDKKNDKYGYVSQRNVEDLEKELSSKSLKPITVSYDPQSYRDTFCALYKVLRKETDEKGRMVLVDSTSTTKEAYGATVTISLMFKNVRIYIVPPKERGWYAPEPESPVFNEWFLKARGVPGMIPQEIYLPGDRLKQPNEKEKQVLLKLNEHGGHSRSLASIIKWCNEDAKDAITKNRFSRLIRRIRRKGFIEEEFSFRGKRVSLTHFGKTFAMAMKLYETDSVPND